MFPAEAMLTEGSELYPGHAIRRGNLVRTVSGGTASVSGVLSAAEDALTERLVSSMNVLRGVDVPFYIAHHTGGYLGNESRNDQNAGDLGITPLPTIDQIMAWSPSFYPNLDNVTLRSIITGSRNRMSYMWSNPSERTGTIEEVRRRDDAAELFREVFVPGETAEPTEPPRPAIVDRVLENYRSLRQSSRRLGAADRQRLDDHLDRLAELERRLNATPVSRASCGDLEPPVSGSDYGAQMEALIDVVVAAFTCGTSRIAVMGLEEERFVADNADWHQSVAHQHFTEEAQLKLFEANQKAFEVLFVALANKLDVEEAPGVTVLDNTLMMWSQESGADTHYSRSVPIVTFGGAAGQLRTGNAVDYRNQSSSAVFKIWSDVGPSGLLYAQWLATVLRAMGVPSGEWQDIPGNAATGYSYSTQWLTGAVPSPGEALGNSASCYVAGVTENASEILPLLAV